MMSQHLVVGRLYWIDPVGNFRYFGEDGAPDKVSSDRELVMFLGEETHQKNGYQPMYYHRLLFSDGTVAAFKGTVRTNILRYVTEATMP